EEAPKPAPKKAKSSSGVSKVNNEAEKSTLGDLEALSALKEQMQGNQAAAAKKASAKAKEDEAEAKSDEAEEKEDK
ncbi:MAG: 30S ribosomal protein S1, partial [Bacteroidota bacterium]